MRALRSFQTWGILNSGVPSHVASVGATPLSPPSTGIVAFDRAAAAFQNTDLISRMNSATSIAAVVKSPAKHTNHAAAVDAGAPSPAKITKSGAKSALVSPDKKQTSCAAKCAAAERTSAHKVIAKFDCE